MRSISELNLMPRDRRAIEKAAGLLRSQFGVERVVLFGSKARGDDRSDSDIDLLVLTHRQPDTRMEDAITDALFDIQLDLGVLLSVLIVSVDDWDNGLYRVLPIKHAVDREGALA